MQVSSLRALVEDWEFQEAPFLDFVAPTLQALAGMLQGSQELDTQLQALLLSSCACKMPAVLEHLHEPLSPCSLVTAHVMPESHPPGTASAVCRSAIAQTPAPE